MTNNGLMKRRFFYNCKTWKAANIFLWQVEYFAVIAATLMAAQRQRIGVPGAEHVPSPSVPLFGLSFISPRLVPAGPPHFEEEYLG